MTPVGDQSSVPVERTAVPAAPPWPCVIEGRCTWCGGPESEHEGGVREHHRIEVVGGRYGDEPEVLRPPGLPALAGPGSPGVTGAGMVAVWMPAEAARWLSRHLLNAHHELRGRDAGFALAVRDAADDGMICHEPAGIGPPVLPAAGTRVLADIDVDPVAGEWPGVDSTGGCALCGERHGISPREHHRGDLADGRYASEVGLDLVTGVAAPVDPESPGVSAADLARVVADRLHGCVTPTPSGWVKLAGAAVGGRLVLTVTMWGPLSAGMPALNRTVLLGLASAPPGARPGTAGS